METKQDKIKRGTNWNSLLLIVLLVLLIITLFVIRTEQNEAADRLVRELNSQKRYLTAQEELNEKMRVDLIQVKALLMKRDSIVADTYKKEHTK